jgi:hypothetical protein
VSVDQPIFTDAQKLELRPSLARLHGALMRAWQLGMLVPANEADEQLLRDARKLLVTPGRQSSSTAAPPGAGRQGMAPRAAGLAREDGAPVVPLSDEEYLVVFDRLFLRFRALAVAYRRGAQASALAELGTSGTAAADAVATS